MQRERDRERVQAEHGIFALVDRSFSCLCEKGLVSVENRVRSNEVGVRTDEGSDTAGSNINYRWKNGKFMEEES